MAISIDVEGLADPRSRAKIVARAAVDQELPSYNRSILDRSIARALRRNDGSRPVIPHSGVYPHLPKLDGTDSHLYFGWYLGDERQLPAFAATVPRLVRFVSEFGAQSVPADADFIDPDAWPDLDWDHLSQHHSLQKVFLDRYVPPGDHATFQGWAEATREYQANLVRHHIETLRRLKYRPTGGFTQFCFADSVPGITWSVLSVDRVPKEAYRALADACRPVIVVAERPPDHLHCGDPIEWDVHVVSDLRVPLTGVRVTARLVADHAEQRFGWEGDVGVDECVRVGHISTTAPSRGGPLRLLLELHYRDHDGDETIVANDYETSVVTGHHQH
jgi:beta-mannosidase